VRPLKSVKVLLLQSLAAKQKTPGMPIQYSLRLLKLHGSRGGDSHITVLLRLVGSDILQHIKDVICGKVIPRTRRVGLSG
jgi:hypothetical protein